MDNTLIPNYIDVDYTTLMTRLKSILASSDTFKDYDFEGANFTMLMELVSYLGELNTFYTNTLAKNIHNETADVYEVVHSLVRRQGYEPLGYTSAYVNVDLTLKCSNTTGTTGRILLTESNVGDHVIIPQWYKIEATTNSDDKVFYTTTETVLHTVATDQIQDVTGFDYVIPLTLVQGEPILKAYVYNHSDIVDNKIYLPKGTWDHNTDNNTVAVMVDGELYTRVDDTTDYQSADNLKTYTVKYDKYGKYYIKFSSIKYIPISTGIIKVLLVKSAGINGPINKGSAWTKTTETQVCNMVDNTTTTVRFLTISNGVTGSDVVITDTAMFDLQNNEVSIGGADPQTIEELKISGDSNVFSQLRNVTPEDYSNHLISRTDIDKALAWGENEINLGNISGTTHSNNVYLTVIPNSWTNTIINLESMAYSGTGTYEYENQVVVNDLFYKHSGVTGPTGVFPSGAINVSSVLGTTYPDLIGNVWEYTGSLQDRDFWNKIAGVTGVNGPDVMEIPKKYGDTAVDDLRAYLKPRKMIGVDEIFELPHLVFFKFDIGIRVKRSHIWANVRNDVNNKLSYFFTNNFRVFGDIIDIGDIINFITDESIVSTSDEFSNIKGIQNINIRNVTTFSPSNFLLPYGPVNSPPVGTLNKIVQDGRDIGSYIFNQYDPNYPDKQPFDQFPFYMDIGSDFNNNQQQNFDNYIKPIKLGYRQYPIISLEYCRYYNEERK